MPSESRMGSTITAMEITGPIPVMDIKIMAVTIHRSAMVILLIAAQLNHLTNQGGRYAGVHQDPAEECSEEYIDQNGLCISGRTLCIYILQHLDEGFAFHGRCGRKCVAHQCRAVQNVAMIANPTIRLNPFTQYHTMPKKDRIMIIPIITLMFIRTLL